MSYYVYYVLSYLLFYLLRKWYLQVSGFFKNINLFVYIVAYTWTNSPANNNFQDDQFNWWSISCLSFLICTTKEAFSINMLKTITYIVRMIIFVFSRNKSYSKQAPNTCQENNKEDCDAGKNNVKNCSRQHKKNTVFENSLLFSFLLHESNDLTDYNFLRPVSFVNTNSIWLCHNRLSCTLRKKKPQTNFTSAPHLY